MTERTAVATLPASVSPPTHRLLRRAEASEYIRTRWGVPCATRTLAKLFSIGGGPLVQKVGRIPLYDPSDLDTFCAAKLSPKVRSSSELTAA
jgi:hypothetical protein